MFLNLRNEWSYDKSSKTHSWLRHGNSLPTSLYRRSSRIQLNQETARLIFYSCHAPLLTPGCSHPFLQLQPLINSPLSSHSIDHSPQTRACVNSPIELLPAISRTWTHRILSQTSSSRAAATIAPTKRINKKMTQIRAARSQSQTIQLGLPVLKDLVAGEVEDQGLKTLL